MDSMDLEVLRGALSWCQGGHIVNLVTVVETWGSAPRPPGSMLVIRQDGLILGSVSGGCVEDDLIERWRQGPLLEQKPTPISYGVTKEEASRFGLPCGGSLQLIQEPIKQIDWLIDMLRRLESHELVARVLDIETGEVWLEQAKRHESLQFDGKILRTIHGPRWRLLIVGAVQLARYLVPLANTLDYEVTVCDPRQEYAGTWDVPHSRLNTEMPDDVVRAMQVDANTAIVAITHDAKLDDMALLEALPSPAFYVGALGSRANTQKRKERLKQFDLSDEIIARLSGPIGLRIGSRTPPEMAVSIMAEMTAVRNRFPVDQVFDKTVGNFTLANLG